MKTLAVLAVLVAAPTFAQSSSPAARFMCEPGDQNLDGQCEKGGAWRADVDYEYVVPKGLSDGGIEFEEKHLVTVDLAGKVEIDKKYLDTIYVEVKLQNSPRDEQNNPKPGNINSWENAGGQSGPSKQLKISFEKIIDQHTGRVTVGQYKVSGLEPLFDLTQGAEGRNNGMQAFGRAGGLEYELKNQNWEDIISSSLHLTDGECLEGNSKCESLDSTNDDGKLYLNLAGNIVAALNKSDKAKSYDIIVGVQASSGNSEHLTTYLTVAKRFKKGMELSARVFDANYTRALPGAYANISNENSFGIHEYGAAITLSNILRFMSLTVDYTESEKSDNDAGLADHIMFPGHTRNIRRFNVGLAFNDPWKFGTSFSVIFTREELDRDDTPDTDYDMGRQRITFNVRQKLDIYRLLHGLKQN